MMIGCVLGTVELSRAIPGAEGKRFVQVRCGGSLPTLDYFQRFFELGGKIVTVGSDAHDVTRAGQYTHEMTAELKKIFGYVCTFEDRRPIFHK